MDNALKNSDWERLVEVQGKILGVKDLSIALSEKIDDQPTWAVQVTIQWGWSPNLAYPKKYDDLDFSDVETWYINFIESSTSIVELWEIVITTSSFFHGKDLVWWWMLWRVKGIISYVGQRIVELENQKEDSGNVTTATDDVSWIADWILRG